MKLIIVSGRAGSGKSTALHVLEDLGFYCIDNLPIGLLFPLTTEAANHSNAPDRLGKMAVSIDARNLAGELTNFETIYRQLQGTGVTVEIIYLDADEQSLLQRFHATRRKHPLSDDKTSLREAIGNEKHLLEPLSKLADLYIDTTGMSMYELRDMVKQRIVGRKDQELALLFQSFGFKHGVPLDSDYVFDVRCLPNPYWDTSLRQYVGTDQPVIEFLEKEPLSRKMVDDLIAFLDHWLPSFADSNRSYMTISIGCTGGQHRSVYVCEQLGHHFRQKYNNVQVRHTELPHLQTRDQV
ncbi:glmZ(sRNA)-inactivating NTPase [Marinobacter lipolyticus SM19]|uniref:GlmZ(SRNA)-inactivating NTPase n=1 Tax=Marinobacter lipolyticus SM19 TaxID=1318628 RepID=R8B547_9GAMM|nr:RNase adapter RapZ [Marinobacter lipolyticus]EON93743.1 glmZ(sRNA)-inactivating NTPase [Marinobacter lipolyticus SM19]